MSDFHGESSDFVAIDEQGIIPAAAMQRVQGHIRALQMAAETLGAVPADIAGLWFAPGYPELTSGQLLQIAGQHPSNIAP